MGVQIIPAFLEYKVIFHYKIETTCPGVPNEECEIEIPYYHIYRLPILPPKEKRLFGLENASIEEFTIPKIEKKVAFGITRTRESSAGSTFDLIGPFYNPF